ncbi:SMP-30/gluconolactonase/LRE family protein [Kiloniella majae]|uniref:SMP-30/gluconolactonase/LRE family protein n=1 Tax=Kiloniella majae TaxID=1938558 RepID=UPI000A2780E1|nr:SMP-30/gluconolactonase/LRE family protein [Kiloniella majae]
MNNVTIHSRTNCLLGEGLLWHPEREQLFWFDILSRKLLTIENGLEKHWSFENYVSAAGWINRDTLLIASSIALWTFDLKSGHREKLIDLEADNPVTRSNDGRTDPWGGFWIGTMGINAEPGAGSIYRLYQGELRKLVNGITISNAICFSPNRDYAYYTDTKIGNLLRQKLDQKGWPLGEAEILIDLSQEDFGIDGAIVDSKGFIWNAQWGASRVAQYTPEGKLGKIIKLPTSQTTCPAFGGKDLMTLFVTSATEGLDDKAAGNTFKIETGTVGLPEYQIKL